jgi:signal transduction histidine kinase
VEQLATEIEIEVQDNGKGMPMEKTNGSGVGLLGLRERARQLGGTVEVESNGKGTRVFARLPISKGFATAKGAARS